MYIYSVMSCTSCTVHTARFDPAFCPVRQAIDGLYAGGRVTDVRSSSLSVSYGDMAFLVTCKTIDLARFKLSNPTLEKCLERFVLPVPSAREYYEQQAWSPSKPMFLALFARAISMVKKRTLVVTGKPLSVTIPPPVSTFDVQRVCLDPDVLQEAVNWIVKTSGAGDLMSECTAVFPTGDFPAVPDTLDAKSALDYLTVFQKKEIEILDYAAKVEEYQAAAYAKLEEIIGGL